jgi:hypothetical protein
MSLPVKRDYKKDFEGKFANLDTTGRGKPNVNDIIEWDLTPPKDQTVNLRFRGMVEKYHSKLPHIAIVKILKVDVENLR